LFELNITRVFPGDRSEPRKTHKVVLQESYLSLEDALDAAQKLIVEEDLRRQKTPNKAPFLSSLEIICPHERVLNYAAVRKLAKQVRD